MTHPTTEQLNDPKWWDETAPTWATSYGLAGHQKVPVWCNLKQYQHVEGVQAHVIFAFDDPVTFDLAEIEWVAGRPNEDTQDLALARSRMDDESETVSLAELRDQANRPYHPDPGTEALATWLEPPDGGDRRPERVTVMAYGVHPYSGNRQVWIATQTGEAQVHLTENVLFEPLPSVRNELKRLIADSEHYGHDYVTDAILALFDVSLKE